MCSVLSQNIFAFATRTIFFSLKQPVCFYVPVPLQSNTYLKLLSSSPIPLTTLTTTPLVELTWSSFFVSNGDPDLSLSSLTWKIEGELPTGRFGTKQTYLIVVVKFEGSQTGLQLRQRAFFICGRSAQHVFYHFDA